VANLEPDHDIQTLGVLDLADKALEMAGDPENENRTITHIFYNRDGRQRGIPLGTVESVGSYKSARIVAGEYANPANPTVHSGYQVVRSAFATLRDKLELRQTKSLDVYVDLLDRSMASDFLLQEFMELPWRDCFDRVRCGSTPGRKHWELPEHLRIEPAQYDGLFSDVEVFHDWLENGDSEFLVTLTGDGSTATRSSAGPSGIEWRGIRSGLRIAHAEPAAVPLRIAGSLWRNGLLHSISSLGAFVFTAVFGLRFRVILSDPFTGFRMYRRGKMNEDSGRRWPLPPAHHGGDHSSAGDESRGNRRNPRHVPDL